MNSNLKLASAIFIFIVIFTILHYVKKRKINIKYSVVWIVLFGILFIFLLIPGLLELATKAIGFQIPSNMIFSVLIGVLVMINIAFTAIMSSQDKKIRKLIQEVSILKKECEGKNGKNN